MKMLNRCFVVLLVLCLLCPAAFAEDCGIGEAVSYVPEVAAVAETPEAPLSMAAVPATTPAPVLATETSPADENSTRGFVYRMYKIVLGREPDPDGFESWVKALESGGSGAADLIVGFFNSDEYTGQHKSSENVVNDCYKAMLNRPADAAGLESWKKVLDIGMSSDTVCAGFVNSSEFQDLTAKYGIQPGTIQLTKARDQNYERTYFVYRLYQECLKRSPDLTGLESWCSALGGGSEGTNVAYGFVFSDEYTNRLPTNEEYVTMLYSTILGRAGDASGTASWVKLLDFSNTRERVLNGFMFSPEFAAMCARAGIRVGSKVYEPDDTREWKANILVLTLVNAARSQQGLLPLVTREDLWERVALIRAAEVAYDHNHKRPDGSLWTTAYSDAGFPDSAMSENIAWGFTSEQAVVQAWLNSASHRANILSNKVNVLATGLSEINWSQNFYNDLYVAAK